MAYYEYKNHASGIPDFVTRGGAFYDPDTKTSVTYIPDNRDYWIPDTLISLTKVQIQERALDIHGRYPFKMIDVSEQGDILRSMTEQEVVAWVLSYFENMEAAVVIDPP